MNFKECTSYMLVPWLQGRGGDKHLFRAKRQLVSLRLEADQFDHDGYLL
jgi:hypothetical protein